MSMKQKSFATTGFEIVTKRTRKSEFLGEMNLVVPWAELFTLITPYAPASKAGRPPFAGLHHAAYPLPATIVGTV